MKIELHDLNGQRIALDPHREGAARLVAKTATCPACSAPLLVLGDAERQEEGHDTITAPAHCGGCSARVGTITVTISTVFGLEEDRRVLNGRCRVY